MSGPPAGIALALLDAEGLLTINTRELRQIFGIAGGSCHIKGLEEPVGGETCIAYLSVI
jgi:hypothetical protein